MLVTRFAKFILVGGLNTAFGYALFAAIFILSGSVVWATIVATAGGLTFNFFTTGRLVFGSKSLMAFLPFVLGYGLICLVNIAALKMMMSLGVPALVAQAVCIPFLAVAAFAMSSFVFARA